MKARLATGLNKSGFTLLEVLIALVIISLTLSAVIKVSSTRAVNLAYLENKTFALWIAQDTASKIQIGLIKLSKNTSFLSGDILMANKNWHWNARFQNAVNNQSVRANITVNLKNQKDILARYVTYYGAIS